MTVAPTLGMLFSAEAGTAQGRWRRMMAALISWICRFDHAVTMDEEKGDRAPTTITIHRGQWAYCTRGDLADCIWEAIAPTPLELLHSIRRPSETSAGQRVSREAE